MSGAESLSFGGQFRISLPRVGPASARRPAPGSRVASFLFAEESPAAPPAPAVGAPRRSERPGRQPPARRAAPIPVSARNPITRWRLPAIRGPELLLAFPSAAPPAVAATLG